MSWTPNGHLNLEELRATLKDGRAMCAREGCSNIAVDVHHVDGHHSNNDPTNLVPACKLCHNEEHGIEADIFDLKLVTRRFYDAQRQRIKVENSLTRRPGYRVKGAKTGAVGLQGAGKRSKWP